MNLRSHILLSVLCGALLCELSAAERGGARPAKPIPTDLKIHVVAHAFRLVAATDVAKALQPIESGASLSPLLNHPLAKDVPAVWSYFFCGASLWLGNAAGDSPIVGYYNPYLDGLLLTQWKPAERGYAITAADLLVGAEWAGLIASGDPMAPWWIACRDRRSRGAALTEQYRKVADTFSRRHPLSGKDTVLAASPRLAAAVEIMVTRAAGGLRGILNVQSKDRREFNPAVNLLAGALRQPSPAALRELLPAGNTWPADEIMRLPADVRQRMAPCFSLISPEVSLVCFADPKHPRFVLMAGLRQPPNAKVEALGFYDLAPVASETFRK